MFNPSTNVERRFAMKFAVRSALLGGTAVVGTAAIAIPLAVQPLPPPAPAIHLAAVQQQASNVELPVPEVDLNYLGRYVARIVLPPSLGVAPPAPPPLVSPSPASISGSLENLYHWV